MNEYNAHNNNKQLPAGNGELPGGGDEEHREDQRPLAVPVPSTSKNSPVEACAKFFECVRCGKKFKWCYQLRAHLRDRYQVILNAVGCTTCGAKCATFKELWAHYKYAHGRTPGTANETGDGGDGGDRMKRAVKRPGSATAGTDARLKVAKLNKDGNEHQGGRCRVVLGGEGSSSGAASGYAALASGYDAPASGDAAPASGIISFNKVDAAALGGGDAAWDASFDIGDFDVWDWDEEAVSINGDVKLFASPIND